MPGVVKAQIISRGRGGGIKRVCFAFFPAGNFSPEKRRTKSSFINNMGLETESARKMRLVAGIDFPNLFAMRSLDLFHSFLRVISANKIVFVIGTNR